MKKRLTGLGLFVLGQLAIAVWSGAVQATDNIVEFRGGSDFSYFYVRDCDFSKYAILPNYETNKDVIDARLTEMYMNGQRRIRTAIPLPENPDTTDGMTLPEGFKNAVKDFLDLVKRKGFQRIEIVIGSLGPPPFLWKEWHEELYARRLRYILGLHPLFVASQLHYDIDLLNEGIPAGSQPIMLSYTRRLWLDYTKIFGKKDTIGFSIIAAPKPDRFAQIPRVYGNNPPDVLDLHIYDDTFNTFINAHTILKALGYGSIPWIIGESFYNDKEEAEGIVRAIQETGQRVLFLLQWPLRRTRECNAIDVVPLDFGEYLKRGF